MEAPGKNPQICLMFKVKKPMTTDGKFNELSSPTRIRSRVFNVVK